MKLSSSSVGAEQGGQAFALARLPYNYAFQGLGQQRIESRAQNLNHYSLPQGLGFDRLMRSPVLVAAIMLYDARQIVLGDLLLGERSQRRGPPISRSRTRRVLASI